jgi:uncharacterized membrane protein (UPF0127 family)
MRTERLVALLLTGLAILLLACGSATAGTSTETPDGRATPVPTEAHTDNVVAPGETVASTAYTQRAALPIAEFTNGDGEIARLPIEVPPRTEYSIGLSGRTSLDERGMLFYFPEAGRGPFWMKNTHIDLSIAFITKDGMIVDIREMQAETLDLVIPNAAYRYAIEAPAGWYARHKVRIADSARLAFPLPKEFQD